MTRDDAHRAAKESALNEVLIEIRKVSLLGGYQLTLDLISEELSQRLRAMGYKVSSRSLSYKVNRSSWFSLYPKYETKTLEFSEIDWN